MTVLYIIAVLVLIFDFITGFHDSANSIATFVSTKVLSPFAAVSMAAFFNFIAFTIFPLKVAATMGKGIVDPDVLNLTVIAAALIAAITWNLLTWWWGLPSSSSHTLVGGLIGATLVSAGTDSIIVSGVMKIVAFIVISPLLGMILGFSYPRWYSILPETTAPSVSTSISGGFSFCRLQPSVSDTAVMMPRNPWE